MAEEGAARTIADRYDLESQLGSGGMGSVWKANDRVLDRTVAIKILHDDLVADASVAERFRREARAAARLAHPNIVGVFDTGDVDGVPFIVMEYVEGRSLHDIVLSGGPLSVEDVVGIAHSILSALDHAHERLIVHRDIKPANILLESRTGTAKIVDFGIAKRTDEPGVTSASSLVGTASYMSPEQLTGKGATAASDLYAVGCVLYFCATGAPPFHGDSAVTVGMHHVNDPVPSLRERRPSLPMTLEAVVMKALEKDPSRRFASARAMARAIEGVEVGVAEETAFFAAPVGAEPIKVLLVDDHELITHALSALIDKESDMHVIGSASSGAEGKALAHTLEPDVILMDYEMPGEDGAHAAHDILEEHPEIKIVMLTGSTTDDVLVAAVEAGCTGFVPKEHAVKQVIPAIRAAHAGEAPISPELLARLLPRLRDR